MFGPVALFPWGLFQNSRIHPGRRERAGRGLSGPNACLSSLSACVGRDMQGVHNLAKTLGLAQTRVQVLRAWAHP